MSEPERPIRRVVTTRTLKPGAAPPDDDWAGTTAEERIEAVWTLTLQCLQWNREDGEEPRLDKSVVRIVRRQGAAGPRISRRGRAVYSTHRVKGFDVMSRRSKSLSGAEARAAGRKGRTRFRSPGWTAAFAAFVSVGGVVSAQAESRGATSRPAPSIAVLQERPSAAQIPDAGLRASIDKVGAPWRVVLMPAGVEFVLIPPGEVLVPLSRCARTGMGFLDDDYRDFNVDVRYAYYLARSELRNGVVDCVRPTHLERESDWYRRVAWDVGAKWNPKGRFVYEPRSLSDRRVLGATPERPAGSLSLEDASEVVRALGARLPSEAEWMRANFELADGDSISEPPDWASWPVASHRLLSIEDDTGEVDPPYLMRGPPVGARNPPNGLGLFDMAGGVSEWACPSIRESAYRTRRGMSPGSLGTGHVSTWPTTSDDRARDRKERSIICDANWYEGDQRALVAWRRRGILDYEKYRGMSNSELWAGLRPALDVVDVLAMLGRGSAATTNK
jgi:formylglycine-generating enzyme required for sulfatase activity